ncbi:extracellular solute-binding protein [Salinarimonas ramus]|uniref:ABC transporter substrate-binding protein n=1 Tax=Salinarimonas ramus TaxID=690164 RepID=A0A917V815_9HYPH|nr:extracellular solute-binding protein [Salinarimonas ramus]GGK50206.1 ABC transporter substrate-binding protein [Salinarimonas ramus]
MLLRPLTARLTRTGGLLRAGMLAALLIPVLALPAAAQDETPAPSHGMSMHGEPELPADFTHFPYADPEAPVGGRVAMALQGTYDGLNPTIVLGVAPDLAQKFVWESLMKRSLDEPFSLYGLVARSVTMPEDRSWAQFALDPRATFSDGEPLTAEDVRVSFELLREKGKPYFRGNFAKVTEIEIVDDHTIRFDFGDSGDRELPLLIAMMPIFATHTIDPETFDQTSLVPPIGSGPYEFAAVEPGERVVMRRRADYWGADLPVNVGMNLPEEIRYEFFRDANTMFEGFKTGIYDLRVEGDPTRWATGYDFPAMTEGRIVKEEVPQRTPQGMNGFVFNTRKDLFADRRVRQALGHLFDFQWVNENLLFGLFQRAGSYFDASDLSARGRPASEAERALLAPYADALLPEVMDGTWQPPQSDGSGRDRTLMREAVRLLGEAGWRLDGGVMRNAETGAPFAFEFLAVNRQQERLALNFADSLKRVGIDMSIRLVDDAQYWRRLADFDYDMIQWTWPASPSPGNEQVNRWTSAAAERSGSLNFAGAREPGIDAMIAAMLAATDRGEFETAVRALDRLLISGVYVVPLYIQSNLWVAYDSALERPDPAPLRGLPIEVWRRAGD